jgi:hypothetical protein
MDPILRRLDEIDAQLAVPSGHFRADLLAERDDLIDRLGESYLAATPRRRGAIHRFVAARHRLVMAFEDRVTWHAFRIKTIEDVHHLRLGLVTAAIVGGGIDPRDFSFRLGHLSEAATRAGLDPRPRFREAMDLAGRRRSVLRPWS